MFKNYLDWVISSEASNKCLFRRANGYLLDERSTTIEHELVNNINSDIEQLLNINLKELIISKVGSSESKWT